MRRSTCVPEPVLGPAEGRTRGPAPLRRRPGSALDALLQRGTAASEPRLPHTAANLLGEPVDMWTIGFADGCASPASRASSESGEMLAFAHIPTGTTANKGFDIDEVNSRLVEPAVALTRSEPTSKPVGLHLKT